VVAKGAQQRRNEMSKYVEADRRAQAAAAERLEIAMRLYGANERLSADEVAEMAQFEAARVYDDVFDRHAA
jgi:uncharacterized protein YqeY